MPVYKRDAIFRQHSSRLQSIATLRGSLPVEYAIEPVTVLVQRSPHEHRAATIFGLHPRAGRQGKRQQGQERLWFRSASERRGAAHAS